MVVAAGGGTIVPLSFGEIRRTTARQFFTNEWDHIILPDRSVRVWLPPEYDEQRATGYPTLYIHDGEGLMRDGPKSWGLDRTLTQLIAAGSIEAPIVVMVDSTGRDGFDIGAAPVLRRRWLEYGGSPLLGDRYLSFIADELKPTIDERFRTLPAPEFTSTMGSSMGGLCAFLSVWQRPEVFGAAACLSPVFQMPLVTDVALNGGDRLRGTRLYIDNGGDTPERKVTNRLPSSDVRQPTARTCTSRHAAFRPIPRAPSAVTPQVPLIDLADGLDPGYWWLDTNLQPGVDAMCAALRLQGVKFDYHREPGGRHNERAWGRRSARPLRLLLPSAVRAASSSSASANARVHRAR
jgi:hypothetical protein